MSVQLQERALTYRCPHCGTTVEVEPDAAGTMMNCPAADCGKPFRVEVPAAEVVARPSTLILPPGVERPTPSNHAQPSEEPPQAVPMLPAAVAQAKEAVAAAQAAQYPTTPETPGTTIHLSMLRRYPFRCLGYALLAAVGVALLLDGELSHGHWVTGLGAIVLLATGVRFLVWWVRMRATTLTLTNKRGTLATGVFSTDTREFEFANICDFHIHQNLLMRWLNVGDLAIVANNGQRFLIMAVPDPANITSHLQRHVEFEKKAAEQPDMVVVQQPPAAVPTEMANPA